MARILIVLLFFSCTSRSDLSEPLVEPVAGVIEMGQDVGLQISSRVDTSHSVVQDVLSLYENYINAQPDRIYDNPYWNTVEKNRYADFDFSRVSMYNGINHDQLLRMYRPFVLSIEPIHDKYQIRVLYSNSSTEPPYVGSKVWCILKLNAIRENGDWKLENLLVEETKNWKTHKVGFIEYIYPQEYTFDLARAQKAMNFCNHIISRFNPSYNDPFKFYLANGVDNMGILENFDYYFSGVTTGKAREGMILSSKRDEYYPHEFIHKLLPTNEHRGDVIEEGLATFLGSKEDLKAYTSIMQKLARDYNRRESFTLENILNNQTKWNGYPTAYPGGALICELIHGIKGDEGIIQLAKGKTKGYTEIISLAQDILQLKESEVIRLIDSKIKEFG